METPRTVLFVDDDEGLARTTSLILELRGYAVTTAGSGSEAISLTRETAFDLTFLDIKMPEVDGVETLRELKRLRPTAVVVMMTAYTMEQRIGDALREGAHAVLRKPLEIEQVLELITQTLAGREGMQILVVDDDDGTLTTLEAILTQKGYTVGTASTGEQAIRLVRAVHYDAILLDLRLPDKSGLEVSREIRALDPRAVVFLITAYRQNSERLVEEAIGNTVRSCLDKPLEPAEVLRILYELRNGEPHDS